MCECYISSSKYLGKNKNKKKTKNKVLLIYLSSIGDGKKRNNMIQLFFLISNLLM